MRGFPSSSPTAILLFLALSLLVPSTALGVWPFSGRNGPDPLADPGGSAAQLLSRAIRIDSVNPPGGEEEVAALLVDFLRDQGVESRLIETPGERRGAAWARIPGSGEQRPIVLLSHLDVVPAGDEGWAVDPFQGLVAGGYVVGRGALDAKGVAVVQALALVELARRQEPLARDVILLATPDEETGGRDGAGYLVRKQPHLLGGAEFLLTEGGGILLGEGGRPNIWGVSITEKAPCWTRLWARGTPGHASTADGGGAVPRLVAALERVRNVEVPIVVIPEVERMFAALAPLADAEDRAYYQRLGAALRADAKFRQRFLADGARAALVRDTVTITVLRAGVRTNVVPAEAYAELDVRLLPGHGCGDFLEQLHGIIGDPSIEIESLLSFDTASSSPDSELFRAIESVANEIDPGALVVPRVIAGFTDAHYFRELGIVAYGFVPRWLPPAETRGIHGANERISIENLEKGIRALVKIVERVSSSSQ